MKVSAWCADRSTVEVVLLALMASAIAFPTCRAEPVVVEFNIGEIITSDRQRTAAGPARVQFIVADEEVFRLHSSDAHLRSYLQAVVNGNTRRVAQRRYSLGVDVPGSSQKAVLG